MLANFSNTGRKIWLIYFGRFVARFINGEVMKICSLLASGENEGKIWNLLKPAVVNFLPTSVPVDESFPTRRIHFQDAPTLLKVHFRWSSPPLHIFWTFSSIPALTPVQTSSKSCTSSSSSSIATRHCVVSNAIRILDSTTIQLDFDASSSSFLISRRSLFEIISWVKKGNFILRLVWERIGSIRGTKLFLSIDSVMDELVERWYMDVYRDNTRFVMQPTSFVPPIFFDFQFFLSQTLIKRSFFFRDRGKTN